jgi:hypothetical protein
VEIARLPGAALRYLDETVLPGREYTYSVVTIDAAGNRSPPAREARIRVR